MKLSQYAYLAFALSGAIVTSSCIRDEIPDCPPMKVNIIVKDKNYFNVDKVELEDRLAEDLPFRSYVPTIYWMLRDAETGDMVDGSDLIHVSGDEKSVTPDICPCIPHGKYVLTVWGGLESTSQLSENMDRLTFHPGNTQGADVYMTNDTLTYDAWHNDFTVELERTKGKLIIEKINLPQAIGRSEKNISGIYADLFHHGFTYGGETTVKSWTDIENRAQTVTKTLLSPSVKKDATKLNIKFYGMGNSSDSPFIDTRDVNINMRRNELTVLRYVWDAESDRFKIYILINDSWEMVNRMEVE